MEASRRAYPSDVADKEWAVVVPYLLRVRGNAGQRHAALRELFSAGATYHLMLLSSRSRLCGVRIFLLFNLLTVTLGACQLTPALTAQTVAGPAPTPPTGALTTEAARAAVRRYLSTRPDSAVYLLQSAVIQDEGRRRAVWMPRNDRANTKPARAAFTVDKKTGEVARVPLE